MPTDAVFLLLGCFALVELVTRARITRWAWREIARFFIVMELLALAVVRKVFPPQFELLGGCQKSGSCCQQIVGDPPKLVKDNKVLLNLFASYHRVMHRFTVVGRGDNGELVFSCGHLRTDGRCGIYKYRPLICRNYPVQPFFGAPSVLPGCGYQYARREVAKMRGRESLPILNPGVVVHHPTRSHKGHDLPSDFEWVEDA